MKPLIETINDHHAALKDCIDQYIPLLHSARKSNDPLSEAVQIHEGLRHLEAVVKSYRTDLKAGITEQMATDGEVKAECGPYVVSLRKGNTRAVVTDVEALQGAAPELFKPQPLKVSTAELARVLELRGPVSGAELVEGEPTIMVKGKAK
ncbi:hypothetical protein GS535_05105 [Saccharibacter sp. EH611]|nr:MULTISPECIES: hypothetical protein [unclassified Saccharibacter]MXV35934.1 hypothetical protein [Saccharibacter sp. EH611]MXV58055.1 hypothetical protein [Saccharibacter sp. EH70]MXV65824.1 hypothetical protein [Saccharibacter sp. EH60]